MDPQQARQWLTAERDRLEGLASRSRAEADPNNVSASEVQGSLGQHPADMGTERETQMEGDGLADDAERQRDELDAAIARIDDGSWGTCVVCGRAIDDERLEARPQALRCREHQEEYERTS